MSFEHERDAIRFKEKVLFPGKFRVDIGKINIASLSEAEKTEILAYVDLANGEIKQKIGERVAEVDAFLASLAKKVEPVKPTDPIKPVVSTEPAEPVLPKTPAGEKYLGEEIPENKIKEEIMDSENFGTEKPNPEPRMPEEDPEERERTTRERQERLVQLKTEVEQARKEYVEMDYKKNKAHKRLAKFFGNFFDTSINTSWEADKDVAQCQYFYENKLFEYKNLCLDDAKESGTLGKKLGAELNKFSVDDRAELADVHDQVKVEHHEGRMSGFIKNHSMEIVQFYKKLPLYQKIGIGAAFGIAGGIVTTGSMFAVAGAAGYAGYVASAAAMRRVFMGIVTGTTVAVGLEANTRKNMEAAKEEKEKEFASQLEGKSVDEIYNLIKGNISEINSKQELKLSKTKNKNLRNLAIGAGVGTIVGSSHHWLGMLKETETGKEILGSIHGGINRVMEYFNSQPGISVEGAGTGDITNNNPEYPGYRNHIKIILGGAKSQAGVGLKTGMPGVGHEGIAGVGSHVEQGGLHNVGMVGVESHAEAPVGPALENPI
ncbi:MAG TPA: hypothetical protein VF390_03205, partial [Patescibacteria group bacterium]